MRTTPTRLKRGVALSPSAGDSTTIKADSVPSGRLAYIANLLSAYKAGKGGTGVPTRRRIGTSDPNDGSDLDIPTPSIPLADPDNKDSEIEPSDTVEGDIYNPDQDTRDIIALGEDRLRESAMARRPHEGKMMESLSFWRGEQYSYYDAENGRMLDMRNPTEPDRVYGGTNIIKPKVKKVIARAISGKIVATPSPETALDTDIEGTAEARSVLEDLDVRMDREAQVREDVTYACAIGPRARKIFWNPNAVVPVPTLDANGNMTAVNDRSVGAIEEVGLSCFEMYPDPKAVKWTYESMEYIIFAKVRALSYIRAKFKKYGRFVKGDMGLVGPAGAVENMIHNLTGDLSRSSSSSASKCTILLEVWEKPSDVYPEGRYWHQANGVLLNIEPWPMPGLKQYPIAVLQFEEGLETLWGDSAVTAGIPPQRSRNRALDKFQERLKNGDGKMLVPEGCAFSANAFKTGRANEVMYYIVDPANMGAKPEWFPNAPLDPVFATIIEIADQDIETALSVHEVSDGQTPPGVTAAAAVQQLQDQDQSDSALLHNGLETYTKVRAEIELWFAQNKYSEPRLMAVKDTPPDSSDVVSARSQAMSTVLAQAGAPPQQMAAMMAQNAPQAGGMPPSGQPAAQQGPPPTKPKSQAMVFKNLSKGRFVINAVSSSPKSPAARIQQILDMAAHGMFTPENLPTTIPLLKIMEIEDSDKLIADLVAALNQLNAQNQQSEAAAQKQKDDHEVAMLHAKAEADLEAKLAVLKSTPIAAENPVAAQQAKTQGDMAVNEQKAHQDAEKTVLDTHAKAELAQQAHEHRLIEQSHKGQIDTSLNEQKATTAAELGAVATDQQHANALEQTDVAHSHTMEQTGVQHEQARDMADHQGEIQTEQMKTQAKLQPKPAKGDNKS